jgi:hypothetical protein
MADKPAELGALISGDELGRKVAFLWDRWNIQRRVVIEEWKEQRNFLFATDSSKTTQGENGWKNSTTVPKLTQIRDNLHSNYLSALFPNDDWLRWEAYSREDAEKGKQQAIEAYMANKTRHGHFRTEMSKLLYDYIDYGNSFATVCFEASYKDEEKTEVDFIGPRIQRIAPEAIVFNPTALTFRESPKIIRSVKSIGELKSMAEDEPDNAYLKQALKDRDTIRRSITHYGVEDGDMAEGYQIDGFGNLQEYYMSDTVEVLEFWGDWHDSASDTLHRNRVITVIDRARVIRDTEMPTWFGSAPIYHVGWRLRPHNLWAMGPLNNLVGMQYRLDHLENSKADAYDLAIHPPLAIIGEVEEFEWGPGCEVHIDEGGSVQEIVRNVQWVLQANTEMSLLESRMEQYAGAPREAMGIRSPGEKTAFEVQALENAAGRIFQEKITTFETEMLEPLLNAMLESARRNMELSDILRTLDTDLGVTQFLEITRDDITAKGKLRPIGARHFAAQAQLLQNLSQVMNTTLGQTLAPHLSSIQLAKVVEDTLGLQRFELFSPNIAVAEQQQTQRLAAQAQENLEAEDAVEPV